MSELISKTIIAQYEAIRRSGLTNMWSKNGVQQVANDNNLYDLVNFIEEGRYVELIENYSELIKQITEEDIPKIFY